MILVPIPIPEDISILPFKIVTRWLIFCKPVPELTFSGLKPVPLSVTINFNLSLFNNDNQILDRVALECLMMFVDNSWTIL